MDVKDPKSPRETSKYRPEKSVNRLILEKNNIIVNKNTIPYDEKTPVNPSGIRMGTPAITTRGMKEKEMKKIAGWINSILSRKSNPLSVKKEVIKLCRKFPLKF